MASMSFIGALGSALETGELGDLARSFPVLCQPEDARALVAAMPHLSARGTGRRAPIQVVAAYYQSAEDEAVVDVLRSGFPELLALYDRALLACAAPPGKYEPLTNDLLFALKIFALWPSAGGSEALRRVIEGARDSRLRDGFLWSIILNIYGGENHPAAGAVAAQLASPLLVEGFAAIAFLDFVNTLCRRGELPTHPYANDRGTRWLEALLRDADNASYAHSATAALPFLGPDERAVLVPMAAAHPDPGVRMEAAWADLRSGGTAGLITLVAHCRDPHTSRRSQAYLRELGRADAIPREALERNFLAMAEMSEWLQHPTEFGRAPERLPLVDTREMYWPPTDDRRHVWLFEYVYPATDDGREADRGLGMVGSTTFALFGETTVDLAPEDAYALHCCWELDTTGDPRAPKERSIEAGRRLLSEVPPAFARARDAT